MPLSLHDAFVPTARQIVTACEALIGKAEAHCIEHGIDPAEMIAAQLAPDMAAVPFQVYSVAHHTAGAIAGVRAGKFSPDRPHGEQSFATLKAMLADAGAELAALDPAELDTYLGKPVTFLLGTMEMPFKAENFLLSFSQPNYYFHATTFYDILRHKGVKIGKRDFMGVPRIGF
jgi:hypothetical protein